MHSENTPTIRARYDDKLEALIHDNPFFDLNTEEVPDHDEEQTPQTPSFHLSSQGSSKRTRQPETVELRSPMFRRKPKPDSRPSHQQSQGSDC